MALWVKKRNDDLGYSSFFFISFLSFFFRFSKGKLAKVQEKKAKTGLKGGHLMRKHQRDSEPTKDDPMVASPITTSVPHRPALPTSSLKLITPSNGSSKANGRDKVSVGSFWEDASAAILKAHEAISIDNL